jgi:hypothetical protein
MALSLADPLMSSMRCHAPRRYARLVAPAGDAGRACVARYMIVPLSLAVFSTHQRGRR